MDVELAEEATESLLRVGCEALVAEEDDAVLDEGRVDLLEGPSGAARSTPWISAPTCGVSFCAWITR